MLELNENAVLEALECVQTCRPLPDSNPLVQFFLVRQRLRQPEYLAGKTAELKAVREMIEESLLALLGEGCRSAEEGLQFIRRVFQEPHPQLQDYSLLYYWYMRPDLGLTPQALSDAGGLVDRSLRRRRNDGLHFLAQALVDREVETRRLYRKEVLRSRIPFPAGRSLYGREWLVERILDGLSQGPVLLTGVSGIGKTSLAAEAAHRLIPLIDDLYWIPLLPHMETAAQVREKINTDAQNVDTYLVSHAVLLVLENIRQPVPAFLRHSKTLCTNTELLPDWEGVVIPVPPLDATNAYHFFKAIRGDSEDSLAEPMLEVCGGIPGVMEEYLHWKPLLPADAIPDYLSINQYLVQVWDGLPDTLKRLWVLAALTDSLHLNDLLSLFEVADQDIFELVQKHILMVREQYRLTPHARLFLLSQPNLKVEIDSLIQASLNDIRRIQHEARSWLVMFHHGLQNYISPDMQMHLLKKLSLVIPAVGLWEHWKTTLEQLQLDPVWRLFEEARFLRWQGQFARSMQILTQVVQQMGQQGDFYGYAHALLELALVSMYRNETRAALMAIQDAEKVLRRIQDGYGLQTAKKLQARVFLSSDPQTALMLLKNLTEQDASVLSLMCEAALHLEQPEDAVEYAWQAVRLAEQDSPHHGRALCLLAMALREHKNQQTALNIQQQAVNLLSMTTDMIGLARARNNLGVLYYEDKNDVLAKSQWRAALDLFLKLQDAVGLQTVRANMNTNSTQILPLS